MTKERTAMWEKADTVDIVNTILSLGYRPSLRWVGRHAGKEKKTVQMREAWKNEAQN